MPLSRNHPEPQDLTLSLKFIKYNLHDAATGAPWCANCRASVDPP